MGGSALVSGNGRHEFKALLGLDVAPLDEWSPPYDYQ
ncbi:hypothetical protein LMG9964_05571 [Paraburkholderia phenoliruptrix]|uniref:Uncharacterized protein n=1 Tax=Paraburkholderia phenoliruptrix TaxID=252970 RepID=A0A6J5KE27_9BURK|nr:hypothetical protein LMG9964_05571 [Paraburkholderia phenoliruptrix]